MMARYGIAARFRFASASGLDGPLNDILERAIMLNEIEVGGCDGLERHSKVAHDGNGLKKNFRQKHSRSPIQVDTARVHLFHETAEQSKIEKSGGAEARPVGGRVHMRNVGTDRQMDGNGDAILVRGNEYA